MISEISEYIKKNLRVVEGDSIIFNNELYRVSKENFVSVSSKQEQGTIAFIDGGQAQILEAGNFSLSFIRVAAVVFEKNKKVNHYKNEFYLFTRAEWKGNDVIYKSKIFALDKKLFDEADLILSSNDPAIKTGTERAPISKVANIARRFAELSLAKEVEAEFKLLDGTLHATYPGESKYLEALDQNVSALAKSSSLFTTSGGSPVVALNRLGPKGCWNYALNSTTCFVKLHGQAKHVFRFEGNTNILPLLLAHSSDALFLGYPYGLLLADRLARVSHQERKSLVMKFLLKEENEEIARYLTTTNAHDILDNLG